MDTVEGEAPSRADYSALMILIYLRLTVSVEMSKPRRSSGILLMCGKRKMEKNERVTSSKRDEIKDSKTHSLQKL